MVKTVRDYLFEGGVKGRMFVSKRRGEYLGRVYSVKSVCEGSSGNPTFIIKLLDDETESINGYFSLHDGEATPEEIQRAKESELAKQTQTPAKCTESVEEEYFPTNLHLTQQ